MSSVHVTCASCLGQGWIIAPPSWLLCRTCDATGRTWAPGAPDYGCKIKLGTRTPGEIVTLGNLDRGRLLWHTPRGKDKKNPPQVSYLGLIDDFDVEDHNPTGYPSCVGVASVGLPRALQNDDHYGERSSEPLDPMQRRTNTLF